MTGFRFITGCVVVGAALTALQWATPARTNPTIDASAALGVEAPPPVLQTLQRSCYDCHSNETRWRWYSHVPPASWLVTWDVKSGRGQLNFSRWHNYNVYDRADLLDKMCDLTSKHKMPLWQYRFVHADARLADADVAALCAWTKSEADRVVRDGK